MEDLFRSYWWLLFPLAFFIFGAWDRWLAYKRHQAELDLLRSYSAQGRDPPAELLKAVRDDGDDFEAGGRYGRRYRRRWRYGPYWAWRTTFITGAVAAGFWVASVYSGIPGVVAPFRLVAIIMSFVALGHLVAAIFSTTFRPR